MIVIFTVHARQKLRVLRRHGVKVTRSLVERAVAGPERVVQGDEREADSRGRS